MKISDAKLLLMEAQAWSVPEQQRRAAEIIAAFEVFWRSQPTRGEFSALMHGLVLQSAMLYVMVERNLMAEA